MDKSLVFVGRRGDDARYRMLETVSQYSSGKLEESGEEGAVRSQARGLLPVAGGEGRTRALGLRIRKNGWTGSTRRWATCGRRWCGCLKAGETEASLRLASALWEFCHSRGHYEEGRAWLEDAISRDGAPPPLRARALTGAGVLALLQCEYTEASELLEKSLALYRELADKRGGAEVTEILGGLAREQGDYEQAVRCTRRASPCRGSSETSRASQVPRIISASSRG